MNTIPLDIYDDMPRAMREYLKWNGCCFNKEAYEFAVSMMKKRGEDGRMKSMEAMSKEDVDAMLNTYNITIENKGNYDYVYVAMMCKADYYGSSIEDDRHMARYIKDTCDDIDAAAGTIMRRWYASMVSNGVSVPWEEFVGE